MTPRRTDFQARKEKILTIVVDRYVQRITPVSSQCIVEEYGLDVSSATIRNILANLEEEGYLTHPHTSAGRIPTPLGYRYFVDNLMKDIELLEAEKQSIMQEYEQGIKELEVVLDRTSHILAELTHYPTIITIEGDPRIFCHGTSFVTDYPEFQDFEKIKNILSLLEEKERLLELINRDIKERIGIFIDQELECEEIKGCSLIVSRYQHPDGRSGRIAFLGPSRMAYAKTVSTLDYISQLISQRL